MKAFTFDFNPVQTSIASIACLITFLFITMIVCDIIKKTIEMVRLSKSNDDTNESGSTSIDIKILIYINLFVFLTLMLTICVNIIFSPFAHCEIIVKACLVIFHVGRCNMYLIFIRRIQVIYFDTVFALKPIHTYLIYSLLSIYFFFPFINAIAVRNMFDISYSERMEMRSCTIRFGNVPYGKYTFWGHAILDVIISCYLLYAMIYPLWKFIQQFKENRDRLYLVMIKYCTLYIPSILSIITCNILSYHISIGYNYFMIDAFINGMVLILLHPIHNKTYKRLCCVLYACCVCLLNSRNDEDEESWHKYGDKTNQDGEKNSMAVNIPSTNLTMPVRIPTDSQDTTTDMAASSSQRAVAYLGLAVSPPMSNQSDSHTSPYTYTYGNSPTISAFNVQSQTPVSKLSIPSTTATVDAHSVRSTMKMKIRQRMSRCDFPSIPEAHHEEEDKNELDVPKLDDGITSFSQQELSKFTIDKEISPAPPLFDIPSQQVFEDDMQISDHENDNVSSIATHSTNMVNHLRLELGGSRVEHNDDDKRDVEDVMQSEDEIEDEILANMDIELVESVLSASNKLDIPNLSRLPSIMSTCSTDSKLSNSLRLINYESTHL